MKLRCDNCDKVIDVPDAPIGTKVACPLCGDINVVRAAIAADQAAPAASGGGVGGGGGGGGGSGDTGGSRSGDDRAAAEGFPPARGPEADVVVIRPSLFRARPFTYLLVMLLMLAGFIGGGIMVATAAAAPFGMGALALGGVCLIVLAVWKVQRLGESIRITTKRIIDKQGLLSRNTSEIRIADIRHLEIRQSFWQRIWGIGNLEIATAAADDGVEISMKNCPDPTRLQRIIDLYR